MAAGRWNQDLISSTPSFTTTAITVSMTMKPMSFVFSDSFTSVLVSDQDQGSGCRKLSGWQVQTGCTPTSPRRVMWTTHRGRMYNVNACCVQISLYYLDGSQYTFAVIRRARDMKKARASREVSLWSRGLSVWNLKTTAW